MRHTTADHLGSVGTMEGRVFIVFADNYLQPSSTHFDNASLAELDTPSKGLIVYPDLC
jgi:hypothetical protein